MIQSTWQCSIQCAPIFDAHGTRVSGRSPYTIDLGFVNATRGFCKIPEVLTK
jgi:hypothetical protein